MAKVIVTSELADTLKSLRIENKVQSKDVALHLGKSASYVTKLEKGDIKSIDKDELLDLLVFITGNNQENDEIIDTVYRTLSIKYKPEEIEQMLWASNFDSVYRTIPIPEKFVDEINARLSTNQITVSYLASRINSNESIPPEIKDLDQYQTNAYDMYTLPDGSTEQYIKLAIPESHIREILQKETTATNYITLLAIAFYLRKIECFGSKVVLSATEVDALMREARNCLEQYRIYNLYRKAEILQMMATQEEIEEKLSKQDVDNIHISRSAISIIDLYSKYDIESANQELSSFVANMEWDAPLIMRIASLKFRELGKCSFRVKRRMLREIEEVLSKYLALPDGEKNREEY